MTGGQEAHELAHPEMTTRVGDMITSIGGLRSLYPAPGDAAVDKQLDRLDDHCRAFIAHSPLVVIGTSDDKGTCDVSPKGGPPGFVTVLSDHVLALPDLYGNNRLDSMRNLLTRPGVGLLFIIPGLDEALRVNGRGSITTSERVLAAARVDGRPPRVALQVEVDEAFIHCAKAFRRGSVWRPDAWPDTADMPSAARMLRDHALPRTVPVQAVQEFLEDSCQRTLWRMGGDDGPAANHPRA